jgi:hypothetical protein
MNWSERYRAKQPAQAVNNGNSVTPQKSVADTGNANAEAVHTVNSVHSVKVSKGAESTAAPLCADDAEHEAYEAAERAAIQAEPALPSLGTPERERLDQAQHVMVAGLLAAAEGSRSLPSNKSDARNGEQSHEV